MINTVAEAAAVVDAIGSPAVRTMLDLSAAAQSESEPPAEVLARFLASGHIAHVQLNDRNRRGPGQGDTPVAPVLRVLRAASYTGWVALEPFDYHPDAATCAAASAPTCAAPGRRSGMSAPITLRVRKVELFERPVTLRLPFRFGAATVTHCPQAFVRVEADVIGRGVFVGAAAELMVPKWFDKSPALTHEQNFEQLRESLRLAQSRVRRRGRCLHAVGAVRAPGRGGHRTRRRARAAAAGGAVRRGAARQGGRRRRAARRRARLDARACAPACWAIRGARASTCSSPTASRCATRSAWPTG